MMICPNCGLNYEGPEKTCPDCGAALTDDAPETPEDVLTREAAPKEDSAEPVEAREDPEAVSPDGEETEDAEASDAEDESEETDGPEEAEAPAEIPEAKKKSGKNLAVIILAAVAGLLLIVVVCLAVVVTSLSKDAQMPAFVTSIQKAFQRSNYHGDRAAVTLQDSDGSTAMTLTNDQLSFYYWGEYYYFVQQQGFPFDPTLPLSEQEYSDGKTWQDYFLEGAMTSIQQTEAMKASAAEAGFTMPEDYQSQYDSVIAALPEHALSAGFTDDSGNGDVLAYIQDSYGETVTQAGFEEYLYDSYFVTAYSDYIYESQTATDEEIEAYYEENSEALSMYGITKSDLPNVDVRHILIQPETASEDDTEADQTEKKEAAQAEAQRIYEEWQAGEATEDSFAALAEEYSTDPGSNTNGGLYEDVYPGQMVETFNDWCFDESRQPGDTGIVETDYGFHIMYFVRQTDSYYWKDAVADEVKYDSYTKTVDGIIDRYTAKATEDLAICVPAAVEKIQTDAAQNGAA